MKKIILITIIMVLAVGSGFLAYKKFFRKQAIVKQPTEVSSDIPIEFIHDKDRDGISDAKEKELGTSDYEFDTDHDGLLDQLEIKLGTDPTKKDTDGDGFGDGVEMLKGYDPLKSSKK